MKLKLSLIVAVLASALVIVWGSPISEDFEEDSDDFDVTPHLIGADVIGLDREYFVGFEFFLDFSPNFFCSGIRLNEKWMIATADCVDRGKSTHIGITTVHDHKKLGTQYKNISYLDYTVHPKYDEKTKANNIALVRTLDQRWTQKSLHPKLPAKSEQYSSYVKKTAVVTGFNFSKDAIGITNVIKIASISLKIEEPSACLGWYEPNIPQADSICAIAEPGKGLGERDRGAPLVISNSKENKLIGIATIVRRWPRVGKPIVFTKIAPYLDWIGKVTGIKIEN